MKLNHPVTQRQIPIPEGSQLISITDRKGRIEFANAEFIRVSGFTNTELSAAAHNIVRHPDMPPAAFADLWAHLKRGQPWMGAVKNRCKNGDYYWVDAYVTPNYENGAIVGYQSVRRRAAPELVKRAEDVYARLNRGVSARRITRGLGYSGKLALGAWTAALLPITGLWLLAGASWPLGFACLGLSVLSSAAIGWWLGRPVRTAARQARALVDSPLMQVVYTGRNDDIGAVLLAQRILEARLHTVLGRIEASVSQLAEAAGATSQAVAQTTAVAATQQSETDQVAAAMHEMSATVQEVARHAAGTAARTVDADRGAGEGRSIADGARKRMELLVRDLDGAAEAIRALNSDSDAIGGVLDVIRDIADQTNLLALNAAIEAARAGEQGRGFAVVADEVRALARRTQESTGEIDAMIERLQLRARDAVRVMETSREGADCAMADVTSAAQEFGSIAEAIAQITDLTTQIASSAEEQSSVAEEINRNVSNISVGAADTARAARESAGSSESLAGLVTRFRAMVLQFRL